MSYFMAFLTVLFTLGLFLARRGWPKEPKWKNKLFLTGASMVATALLLLVLIMFLLTVVVGLKMFVAMVAGFMAFLWALRWLLIVLALVAVFFWLKGKFSKKK
ncbi:MAG: hypothetical protein Q8R29_02100 [bacterium]|nr:hypothetical protein [bacterium]